MSKFKKTIYSSPTGKLYIVVTHTIILELKKKEGVTLRDINTGETVTISLELFGNNFSEVQEYEVKKKITLKEKYKVKKQVDNLIKDRE